MTINTAIELWRRQEVQHRTGLSRSHLYQLISNGDFPMPVKLGKKSVAWVSTEIEMWIKQKIRSRNERMGVKNDL